MIARSHTAPDLALMAPPIRRSVTIALWVAKALLAAIFLWAGGAKLIGQPKMVHEFDLLGYGQGFRLLTGTLEVLATALLLLPRTAFYGAVILGAVCLGALVAQLTILHNDAIHAIVMAALLAILAWHARPDWLRAPAKPA